MSDSSRSRKTVKGVIKCSLHWRHTLWSLLEKLSRMMKKWRNIPIPFYRRFFLWKCLPVPPLLDLLACAFGSAGSSCLEDPPWGCFCWCTPLRCKPSVFCRRFAANAGFHGCVGAISGVYGYDYALFCTGISLKLKQTQQESAAQNMMRTESKQKLIYTTRLKLITKKCETYTESSNYPTLSSFAATSQYRQTETNF